MKEKPILFNGDMVRAILSGRKTQIRRVMKNQPIADENFVGGMKVKTKGSGFACLENLSEYNQNVRVICPYGQVGDVLWVRETISVLAAYSGGDCSTESGFDYELGSAQVKYHADNEIINFNELYVNDNDVDEGYQAVGMSHKKSVPSIHMPKWACRIRLEITDIRVERLQDISEEDAKAEGVELNCNGYTEKCIACKPHGKCLSEGEYVLYPIEDNECEFPVMTAKESFESLWQSINGQESWNENPFVWVVEFKRI